MVRSAITSWITALALAIALILAACQPIQPVPPTHTPAGAMSSSSVSPNDPVDVQIANTMSAGPDVVGLDATIMGWDKAIVNDQPATPSFYDGLTAQAVIAAAMAADRCEGWVAVEHFSAS